MSDLLVTQEMYRFLAEGHSATLPVFRWRWTSELSEEYSATLIHKFAERRCCFREIWVTAPRMLSFSSHAHKSRPAAHFYLAFVRKHVSKSRHGCSYNKAAEVLLFTGYIFVLYWCYCEGNVLLCRRVPALRCHANKSNNPGQKGRGEKRRKRRTVEEVSITDALQFLPEPNLGRIQMRKPLLFSTAFCFRYLCMEIKTTSLQNNARLLSLAGYKSPSTSTRFSFPVAPCHVQMISCGNLISFVLRLVRK